jgi:peptide/nickel transport system substrate-binding protein
MMGITRRAQVGLLASVLAINLAGSVLSAQAQTPSEPVSGGRVVVAVEQWPQALHHWLVCCTLFWTEAMVDNLLPDAYSQGPDHSFVPEVLDGEAIVTMDPFTVTYRVKEEAVWNDGVPVSARDFVFTWRAFTKRSNYAYDRRGYDQIRSAEVIDPKTVRFEFRRHYPEYRSLFSDVLPRHVLRGKDLNRAWRKNIPISAGPFELSEFTTSRLVMTRNEDYWGDHLAYLDEVEFRFIPDVGDQIDALAAHEVDVIYPSLHPRLSEVRNGSPGVEIQSSPGPIWEHLDMSFRDGRLDKNYIRRAIATAIDREELMDAVVRPIDPDAPRLDSLLFGVNQPEYESHFDDYSGDTGAARSILEDHGCEEDFDGVYRCDNRLLRFVYYTTNQNPIRRQVAEVIRRQLFDAGIEVEVRRRNPSLVFGRILVRASYDLFNFAWVLDELSFDRDIWTCDGPSNFQFYCNPDVDDLFREMSREIDPDRRAMLANLADEAMADDVASLPLYQRPTFLAYLEKVEGLIDNPTLESFTWNIGDWWVSP